MRLLSIADSVVARAPAKINLFLEILRKREDGYHDLATLMLAVNLFDTLVFRSAPEGCTLTSNRPDLSSGPDNLIVKAWALLQQHAGRKLGTAIRLLKRIPMQAGLGGGSSDAAATLLALDRLWDLKLTREDMADLGAQLGSDVPFFVKADAAWCTGRGEIVEPLSVGARLYFVLVAPPFGCSTAEVYRGLNADERGVDPGAPTPHPKTAACVPALADSLRAALREGDIDGISRGLHNRLCASAQRLAPRLPDYLGKLRELGAMQTLLSGSGSTVFALCRSRAEAKDLARAYARSPLDQNDKVYVVRSCASPLPP